MQMINALVKTHICNFWPQLQILWGVSWPPDLAFPIRSPVQISLNAIRLRALESYTYSRHISSHSCVISKAYNCRFNRKQFNSLRDNQQKNAKTSDESVIYAVKRHSGSENANLRRESWILVNRGVRRDTCTFDFFLSSLSSAMSS